jgi:hypothetical protein
MGNVTSFDGIDIIVRTRREHCEPHVHAIHGGEGWELRIFFSYVTAGIVDVELYCGSTPKKKVIQACMNKVIDKLDKARKLFWEAVQKVCLDNQFVAIVDGVIEPASVHSPGAMRVKSARYDVKKKSIEFIALGSEEAFIGLCP